MQQVTGSVSPLLNESGEVNGAVIMLRDVTREWQQQTFLRISINALRAYSWCYDVDNNLMTVGEGFPKDETFGI